MKVYLVIGDTYFDCYGSDFHCFGIFRTKEKAEEIKKQKEDEFYQKELERGKWCPIESRDDVEFKLEELEIDQITDLDWGGYVE